MNDEGMCIYVNEGKKKGRDGNMEMKLGIYHIEIGKIISENSLSVDA